MSKILSPLPVLCSKVHESLSDHKVVNNAVVAVPVDSRYLVCTCNATNLRELSLSFPTVCLKIPMAAQLSYCDRANTFNA